MILLRVNRVEIDGGLYKGTNKGFHNYCISRGYQLEGIKHYTKTIGSIRYRIYINLLQHIIINCHRENKDSSEIDIREIWDEIQNHHSDFAMKEVNVHSNINIKNHLTSNGWQRMLPDNDWTLHNDDGLFYSTKWLYGEYDKTEYYKVTDMQPCEVVDYLHRLRKCNLLN